jgi:Uma2 family endonuclease
MAMAQQPFARRQKQKGLEPDECYCVGELRELPDIAIEIVLTSVGLDKLEVYKGLGILEVLLWQNQQLQLYDLRGAKPQVVERSQFPPFSLN